MLLQLNLVAKKDGNRNSRAYRRLNSKGSYIYSDSKKIKYDVYAILGWNEN